MAANIQDITSRLGEAIAGSKVFGEPIERGGLTIIPVFRVSGSGGGGGSTDAATVARVSAAGSGSPAGRWGFTCWGRATSAGSRRWTSTTR